MTGMFQGAAAFDIDLTNWDVENALSLDSMFSGATNFSQELCWTLNLLVSTTNMFASSSGTLSTSTCAPTPLPTGPSHSPTVQPTPVPSLQPTNQPTFAPYTVADVSSSIRLTGFHPSAFDMSMKKALKKTLVRILSMLYASDQVTAMSGVGVKTPSSSSRRLDGTGYRHLLSSTPAPSPAPTSAGEVDVYFTLSVVLTGTPTASRRLASSTDFNGTAADLASTFSSDLSSAVASGNLSTVLTQEAKKANATALVNQSITLNTTLAGSTVTTTTTVVTYTKPPTSVPSKLPVPAPSNVPTPLPSAANTYTLSVAFTYTTSSSFSPGTSMSATVKSRVASELGVPEANIRGFTITSSRRLRRRLLATTSFSVSFDVVASLSTVGASDATSWSSDVSSSLGSSSFQTALTSDLGTSTIVSAVASAVVTASPTQRPSLRPTWTKSPTWKPTNPTATPTPLSTVLPTEEYVPKVDDDSISAAHPGMIVGFAMSVFLMGALLAGYFRLKYRRKKSVTERAQVTPVVSPQDTFVAVAPTSPRADTDRRRPEMDTKSGGSKGPSSVKHFKAAKRKDYTSRWKEARTGTARGSALWQMGASELPPTKESRRPGPGGMNRPSPGRPASSKMERKTTRQLKEEDEQLKREMLEMDEFLGIDRGW